MVSSAGSNRTGLSENTNMGPKGPVLWVALFSCLWTITLAAHGGLRLPVPTSETIALVAREMGAATFEESLESLEDTGDSAVAASGRRVQRKLVTGIEDLGDNMEYQEYQGVMGRPGVDFPVLPSIPSTSFSCRAVRKPGYYADLDTDCQVFHICDGGRKISFLCPNGTIFRQSHLICDWWFRVDCGKSVELYEESAEQLAADQRIYKERAEAISKAMNKGSQGSGVFEASKAPPRRTEERPSLGPQTTSPVFETARENYENRQNFRKQNALQQRKQRVQSETPRPQAGNQQQFKFSDVSFTNKPNIEEEEQQVLSETASFAAAQGKRFGKQFFQQSLNHLNSGSVSPQSSTQSPQSQSVSYTTSTQSQTFASSKVPSFDLKKVSFVTPGTESSVSFSSSQSESFPSSGTSSEFSSPSSIAFSTSSTYSSTTPPPTPSTAQRNFKPNNRLLPTSSQNNNFRRGKAFKNRQPFESLKTKVTEGTSSFATQSTADPSSIGSSPFSVTASESEATSSLQSSTAFLNSFSRPSIDLIPPHDANFVPKPNPPASSSQKINQNLRPSAKINSKNINRLGRNKFANLSTKPPLQSSSPNSFTSPAKPSGVDEALVERKYKQRRLPSTTEKPVYTVKFRPNKSFSYIDLERTSPESSTPKNTQWSSTERPQFSSTFDVEPNVHFTSSTRDPHAFSSSSYPSSSFISSSIPSSSLSSNSFSTGFTSSSSSVSLPNNVGEFENFEVTETPYVEEKYQTEWSPTHSPKIGVDNGVSESSSPSSSSYSPTVPDKISSKYGFSNSQQQSQSTQSERFENQESLLDKLADFSNIDPAEINLLPSRGKKVAKANTRIPDSAGPNALHTLALYYATSESDQGTTPAYVSSDSPPNQPQEVFRNVNTNPEPAVDENGFGGKQKAKNIPQQKIKVSDEILLRSHSGSPDNESEIDRVQATVQSVDAVKDLSSVLTKATKDSFSFLFNETKEEPETHTHLDDKPCTGDDVIDLDATKETVTEKAIEIKEDIRNDLVSDQSRGIVQPKSTSTTTTAKNPFNQFSAAFDDLPDDLKLRDSTDLRELAQVFSRALSAYLEDPDSFRRILSEVRPTEPTGGEFATASSVDEHEDEVLDFSDASSTGPRLIPSTQNTIDQDQKVSVDVEEINDLVQVNNVSDSSLSSDLTAPTLQASSYDSPLYTTVNPALFANDINLLSVDTNHTSAESLTENTYFPTSGGVDDKSRPRYGGFQNNSVSSDYKPYGAEVLTAITGIPITQSSFATEAAISSQAFENSIAIGVDTNKYSSSSYNQIDIESIPDQLGIVPAHDINSLVEGHDGQHVLSQFQDHFVPEDSHEIIQTEEEIYGRGSDQENLLIASGSQSLVSRDNYVRFLGSKQEHESKSRFPVPQPSGEGFTKSTESGENSHAPSVITGRGSVKFGPSIIPSPSNFKRRQNKEVTFQNVNLGNGVTLERTKTPNYVTTEAKSATIVPFDTNEANYNPVQINEQLGFITEDTAVSTESPVQNVQTTRFSLRATTYHPETNKPELPDVIPPRGPLRGSWKWSSQDPNTPKGSSYTNIVEQYTSTQANQESSTAYSNFVSTLLPPNVTIETAGEEMLEKKAEEIFGKLNKTSADMLMNVMNQAESNMTVRRLVLLLVADRNGRERSFEESRSQLIQALLQTSAPIPETTSSLEQSTERLNKSTQRKSDRTRGRSRSYPTVAPAQSTQQTTKIPRGRGSKALRGNDAEKSSEKSTVQNERRVNPPQYLRSPNLFPDKPSTATFGADPDGRAVELLKTLYNLAARWG